MDTIIYYRKKHILPLLITILYQLLLVIANNDHIFSLERPGIFTDNMIIWLLKRTPDEDCTQSFSEQLTFNLERFILLSENVYIEDPFGTQILLWPIPEDPTID